MRLIAGGGVLICDKFEIVFPLRKCGDYGDNWEV